MSAMPRTVLQNEESSGTPHDLYYKYFTHRHKVFCSSQHPTVAMELLCKEIENQLFFFFQRFTQSCYPFQKITSIIVMLLLELESSMQ